MRRETERTFRPPARSRPWWALRLFSTLAAFCAKSVECEEPMEDSIIVRHAAYGVSAGAPRNTFRRSASEAQAPQARGCSDWMSQPLNEEA